MDQSGDKRKIPARHVKGRNSLTSCVTRTCISALCSFVDLFTSTLQSESKTCFVEIVYDCHEK